MLIQSKWFFICMYTVSRSPATWMLSMHFLHWWSENILDLSVQVLAFLIQFNSTHSFFTYIFLFNSNKHVFFLVCSLTVQSLCSAFQNYCRFAIGCPGLIVSKIYLVHVLSSLWKQAFKYGNYHIHKWAMKNCKLENQEIRESYKSQNNDNC